MRPSYLFFLLEDADFFDIPSFLRGEVKIERHTQLTALSILNESRVPMQPGELECLALLPLDTWVPASEVEISSEQLKRFVDQGVLLSDGDDPSSARIRHGHDLLIRQQWHPYAALYHFMSRERDAMEERVDTEAVALSLVEDVERHVRDFGPPPSPFPRVAHAVESCSLPLVEKSGGVFDTLARRQTTRGLDAQQPLGLEDLSTLLRYTFGCHGVFQPTQDVQLLHRTSPSGGSLHPIEAYPLVLHVESLEPGFYHYDGESHSLELVHGLSREDAQELAVEICFGQTFVGTASVLVVMVARFFRNFWKYRRQSRAYSVVLGDGGHLSQTFYLVAAELGLGAFYTGALEVQKIDEVLSLVPQKEAAIGICGCGFRRKEGGGLGLEFEPFTPQQLKG